MDQRINSAIQRQRVLSILYDGQWRDFEPFVYGRFALGREYEPVRPTGFVAVYAEVTASSTAGSV